MSIVFDPALFKQRYAEFLAVSDGLLGMYYAEACTLLNPSDQSVVQDEGQCLLLLFMLTAHITKLNQAVASGDGLVGRINSATQGSVSVSTDFGSVTNAQAWYAQTTYGAQYWQSSNKYRRFMYVR